MAYPRLLVPVLTAAVLCGCGVSAQEGGDPSRSPHKPKLIVTTDRELYDSNTLVRYLL